MYLFETYFQAGTSVHAALSQTTGMGYKTLTQTCDRLGIGRHVKLEDLSSSQFIRLNQTVHQNCLTDGEYRAFVQKRIKDLHSMSSYRGFRHFDGLPCRGQRTHTNARTSRKKKGVARTKNNTKKR